MRHQRCAWLGKHDFPYMLYPEGLKRPDKKPFIHQLNAIAALRITQVQLESLQPQDRCHVEQLAEQTQQGFAHLLKALEPYASATPDSNR